ncbi:hypothetical protein P154DRAFT_527240 [Amniculicola lignicola CBS 123094]|uniref:Capsule polysaccharide biosynthesis protein n=1 Tax=Amniculicola lignicola CBS 123094 TaxID=1392246 RepID=A0A6A5W950_9PLEO|nr:hypothetical protein P154DRAFT_527240 [Amniculicola lignicola CBS 123094]
MSKTSLVALGGLTAALASHPVSRSFVVKWSGLGAPGGVWRLLAIFFALVNLKNLPGVWHIRFFRAFFYHLYWQPTPIPPEALFLPVVSSTRSSILETDYNIHKSNSTYFSDMDISRTMLFTAIIRNGIKKNSRLYGKGKKPETIAQPGTPRGKHIIALGGILCNFKREILPYAKFEMWTRLLCWDRKWFYLVTHLVQPGLARPKKWTLQPWRKVKHVDAGDEKEEEALREKLKGAVYATALAKYVIKRGRITVPPEEALIDADMVPTKPEGWVYQALAENGTANGVIDNPDLVLPQTKKGEWNWDVIEAERLRGLKFAEAFQGMDGLHEVFDGGKEGALGEYSDLLF